MRCRPPTTRRTAGNSGAVAAFLAGAVLAVASGVQGAAVPDEINLMKANERIAQLEAQIKDEEAQLSGIDALPQEDVRRLKHKRTHAAHKSAVRSVRHGVPDSSLPPPPNSLTFLGEIFCVAPHYGRTCERKHEEACNKEDDRCHYNPGFGTAEVSCARWFGAQNAESDTWAKHTTAEDRNQGHADSYDSYKSLPVDLGDMAEIGAGPFTQSKTVLDKGHTAKSITLVEPMAFHYADTVPLCTYKNGYFRDLPATFLSIPAENVPQTVQFDTVVMINVIEHVFDAFSILKRVVDLVKPGGYFLYHDRLWPKYQGLPTHNHREFDLHPIRLKRLAIDAIIDMFDTVYLETDSAEIRRLAKIGICEEAVYFIGRKKLTPTPLSTLPPHENCVPDAAKLGVGAGASAVVVAKGPFDSAMKVLMALPTIRSIVLVLATPAANLDNSKLSPYKSKMVTLISGHADWRNVVAKYIPGGCPEALVPESRLAGHNQDPSSALCVVTG